MIRIIKDTPRLLYYEENGIKKIRLKNEEVSHVSDTTCDTFSGKSQSIQRNRISTIRSKYTDALVIPLNREQHKECEPKIGTSFYNKARCFVKYLPLSVAHFFCYKMYLETGHVIKPSPELMYMFNKPDFIDVGLVKSLIKEVQELELSKIQKEK